MSRSDLSQIIEFASEEKGPRSLTLFTLTVASAISPVTYIKPSYADTPPYGLPDESAIRILQVISTWFPTTALLYLACLDFISTRKKLSAPIELEDIIAGLLPEEIRRLDIVIGTISLLSAIPLTTPLVKFPLVDTDDNTLNAVLNTLLVITILVANGIAHLKPLQIIIENPWYGAPVAGAKYLARSYKEYKMTPAVRELHEKNRIKTNKNKQLTSHLVQTMNLKRIKLIDSCFVKKKLGYEIKFSDSFSKIHTLDDDTLIFELANAIELADYEGPRQTKLYNLFLFFTSQIGAALALGISIGYLADSGFELSNKIFNNDIAGWLSAIIPIWAFAVLIHNAARVETLENVDFAISFVRGKETLSWPIKYCAGLYFGILLLPSVALMLLNASAASVVFRIDFEEYCSDDFIGKYLAVFRWGYVWLANLLMKNMTKYLFARWAGNFGTEDAKKIDHFDQRFNNILDRISQWKGAQLQNWLTEQSPELRKKLLNISEGNYQKLVAPRENKEKASPAPSPPINPKPKLMSTCEWIYSIFCCRSRTDSSRGNYHPLQDTQDSSTSLNHVA